MQKLYNHEILNAEFDILINNNTKNLALMIKNMSIEIIMSENYIYIKLIYSIPAERVENLRLVAKNN